MSPRIRLLIPCLSLPLALACNGGSEKQFPEGGGGNDSGTGEEGGDGATDGGTDGGTDGSDGGDDETFDEPGDAVGFSDSDGDAAVDLVDESGESNKGQEFFLVIVNSGESELGMQVSYTLADVDADTASPAPSAPPVVPVRSRPAPRPRRPVATPPPAASYDEDDVGVAVTEFRVRDSVEDDESFQVIAARLWAVGGEVNIFVDNDWPIDWDYDCDGRIDEVDVRGALGFDNCDLATIARVVDENIAPNLKSRFGSVPDINGDGKVSIVISPVLNAMTRNPEDEDDRGSFVASYTDPETDLEDYDISDNPQSDEQEVIFVFAPDPFGFANPFVRSTVESYTSMGLLAEIAKGYLRLISYNAKVLVSDGEVEETWLLEGMGALAADLVGFGAVNHDDVWDYLDAPHLVSLVNDDDVGPINTESWGAQYLFLRWIYDNYSTLSDSGGDTGGSLTGDDFLAALVSTTATGTDAIEEVTGTTMANVVVKWQVALRVSGLTTPDGSSLVDTASYPQYPTASRISAPPDAPGAFYGANGYQTGIEVNGINATVQGGTTDSPEEVAAQRVVTSNSDFATLVPGLDFYANIAGNYGAQVIRLSDIPYDTAAIRMDASGTGYRGVVIRALDPSPGEHVVENIFSSTAANNMSLPGLPSVGSAIRVLGEIGPEGTTVKVSPTGSSTVVSVYDTDRWLLDLSDRTEGSTVRVGFHLERRFSDDAGGVGLSDPWIAVVDAGLVPSPTVDGTRRGTCTEGGEDFGFPASVLDYLYYQVFLSPDAGEDEANTELDTAVDSGGESSTTFDPCGVISEEATTCADDWDRDGVPDEAEPQPGSFVQQVQVMQCTVSGGSVAADVLIGSEILDTDQTDDDSISTFDRAANAGGRFAEDGEEAYLERDLVGGNQYLLVVGGGSSQGSYEIEIREVVVP
jgi:hypothetical protein